MATRTTRERARRPTRDAAVEPMVHDAALTVGVEALLVAGSDAQFREFVADLFAAASSMLSVRRALGRATGLSGSEIAMLLAIRRLSGRRLSGTGRVGVRAIAEHLRVAGPHVTTEIGKLVEAGLLTKHVDANDSRAVDIRLTPEGRQQLRRLTPLVRAANDVLFAGMTPDEMQHVHRFLGRLVATSSEAVRRVEATAEGVGRR